MSSSVFYKFKSQKEPSRVEFDGTGISVWELKRDIIKQSGLGDGTDFDLFIYAEDYSEEYSDDTTIIPRSTTVVARRQPATKPGAGRAARYVTGKMPVNARNSSRREQHTKTVKPSTAGLAQMSTALTEEEKLAAIFQVQSDQWQAQQEEMAHQAPVYKPGAKKPANVPDHDPPNGYVCFRCGRKGHWIQVCPTNDDPEFDNKPRVKRTTGIPRSFLKTVDKSTLQQNEGEDGVKPLAGLMVNAEGDYVIAEPDKASWAQFQAKTKTSAAAQKAASEEDKELEEKGLLCAVDKKLFIDPMKTPCCEKTYCNDCITNALIESDFVCPACQTEGVLIDDLKTDEEASKKIQEYLKEKEIAKTKERSKSPTAAQSPKQASPVPDDGPATTDAVTKKGEALPASTDATDKTKSPTPSTSQAKSPPANTSNPSTALNPPANGVSQAEPEHVAPKKRPAEELLENPKIPKAPKAMQKAQQAREMQQNMMGGMMPNMMMNPMMGMNGMNGFPNMPMGMAMGMPMMPNMGMNMMNPMMGMNGFNQGGFPNMNGGFGNFGGNMGMGNNNNNMNGFQHQHPSRANFTQPSNDEDAYFRKPVNPGRHQNRQRRNRPSDYREL
ncbi:DWNN domain-containing protein [Apiospora aurea]|uniref:DWNN domain-containing protein n=1 Tax=Apiospora aurea TaxID=335848 RepID=A0ABR1QCJ8_9PEZI